jgi:hypothetical protein
MEKRTIIALVLAVVIIFVFQTYFTPQPQQPAPQAQNKEQAKGGEKGKEQTISKEEVKKGEIKQKGKGVTAKSETAEKTAERYNC